jgi:hypothetical protein
MRLLNCQTIKLEDFLEDAVPKYAILSHTWGDEEVSFEDMRRMSVSELGQIRRGGYDKLVNSCAQALRDELSYIWADTCCIDKSSSAELSEAINSMFRWYARAQVCYAYLVDVKPPVAASPLSSTAPAGALAASSDFACSRWFTRGWTLQELLAPRHVVFYAADWTRLSSKADITGLLERITMVNSYYLGSSSRPNAHVLPRIYRASAAERMSWASRRSTTRPEDMAYCLLGLFGINMPLVYGEGGPRAFRRLQEEIMRGSDDMSLLAWSTTSSGAQRDSTGTITTSPTIKTLTHTGTEWSFLADSPVSFANSGNIVPVASDGNDTSSNDGMRGAGSRRSLPFAITNKGLQIDLPLTKGRRGLPYALLRCCLRTDPTTIVALEVAHSADNTLHRGWPALEFVDHKKWQRSRLETFYLFTGPGSTVSLASQWQAQSNAIVVHIRPEEAMKQYRPEIRSVYPRANISTSSTAVMADMEFLPKKGISRMYIEFELGHHPRENTCVLVLTRYSYRGKLQLFYYLYRWRDPNPSPKSSEHSDPVEQLVDLSKTLKLDEGGIYVTIRRESVFGTNMFIVDIVLAARAPMLLRFMDLQALLPLNLIQVVARHDRGVLPCRPISASPTKVFLTAINGLTTTAVPWLVVIFLGLPTTRILLSSLLPRCSLQDMLVDLLGRAESFTLQIGMVAFLVFFTLLYFPWGYRSIVLEHGLILLNS